MSQLGRQSAEEARSYEFGPFRVDAANRLLLRAGEVVLLTSKVFDILLVFMQNSGRLLDKDEVMHEVWPDSFVEEGNLTRNVSTLRKVLGESPHEHQFIVTVPGRGYRFVARVSEVENDGDALVVEERIRARIVTEAEVEADEETAHAANALPLKSDEQLLLLLSKSGEHLTARAAGSDEPFAIPISRRECTSDGDKARRHLKAALFAATLGVILIASGIALYRVNSHRSPSEKYSFERMMLTHLTQTGESYAPTVSPNGEYLAYVSIGKDGHGLWLKQIATGSLLSLMPPRPGVDYWSVGFSRDNSFLYYVQRDEANETGALFRVPLLGGRSQKLLTHIAGCVTTSPDGQRIAYKRINFHPGATEIVIVNHDGDDERVVKAIDSNSDFYSLDWSPDGASIIYSLRRREPDSESWCVAEIPADGGAERMILAPRPTPITTTRWLPDKSGLVMNAIDAATGLPQLWHLSYPGGAERRITNDLNSYYVISITADGNSIVTQRDSQLRTIWVAPAGDLSRAAQLTHGTQQQGYDMVAWTPDHQLVYDSVENEGDQIWRMRVDGEEKRQLTAGPGRNISPAVSPDGRFIVFVSERNGTPQIWRMEADGKHPTPLTNLPYHVSYPQFAPDGQTVFFNAFPQGDEYLWSVSVAGGAAQQVINRPLQFWALAPDGKLLAYTFDDRDGKQRVAISPLDEDQQLKIFDIMPDKRLRWTNDGRALDYNNHEKAATDLWRQPLNGEPPKPLTDFKTGQLLRFAWSNDGQQLAYIRYTTVVDAVLLKFK